MRPLAYISSPYSGDVETNVENAREYSRFAVEQGFLPVTPHIFFTQFMDDCNPADRELAMQMNLQLLRSCDELWVFGNYLSPGMETEITEAFRHHIPIRYF